MPRLLAGYATDVQQADLGDKGTWYRLRIAGFLQQGRRLRPVRPAEGGRRRLLPGQIVDATHAHRAIYGCAGPALSAEERDFFREAQPWGFILFGRNIETPDQVRALVAALRETVGDGAGARC